MPNASGARKVTSFATQPSKGLGSATASTQVALVVRPYKKLLWNSCLKFTATLVSVKPMTASPAITMKSASDTTSQKFL